MRLLEERRGIIAKPRPGEFAALHVPFDQLTAATRVEQPLRDLAPRRGVAALVGRSGAGKTSVLEYVFGPLVEGVLPVRVPVHLESDETVTSPRAFGQHLVRVLADVATAATLLDDVQREEALTRSSDRLHVPPRRRVTRFGLPLPSPLTPALAAELHSATQGIDQPTSTVTVADTLADLLRIIDANGLVPVLVLDDTDKWLARPYLPDRAHVVARFFGPVLAMLHDLPAALVVAVHEEYREMPAYQQAVGTFERSLPLPPVDRAGVAAILDRRIVATLAREAEEAPPLEDIFRADAVERLHGYYVSGAAGSLRRTLQVAHDALLDALEQERDGVTAASVDAAVADLG